MTEGCDASARRDRGRGHGGGRGAYRDGGGDTAAQPDSRTRWERPEDALLVDQVTDEVETHARNGGVVETEVTIDGRVIPVVFDVRRVRRAPEVYGLRVAAVVGGRVIWFVIDPSFGAWEVTECTTWPRRWSWRRVDGAQVELDLSAGAPSVVVNDSRRAPIVRHVVSEEHSGPGKLVLRTPVGTLRVTSDGRGWWEGVVMTPTSE